MRVADESSLLQRGGNGTDGRTLDTEHDGQELMAQREVVPMHPVMRHQKLVPALTSRPSSASSDRWNTWAPSCGGSIVRR
jgi:hypothetical protein